jgi:hypothetical protein
VASSATLDADELRITLDALASFASLKRRTTVVERRHIVSTEVTDARAVSREIRWKVAGTAFSRTFALGWFSRIGHRRRFAWVWMTPRRLVVRIETTLPRPSLVAIPLDWFDAELRDLLSRA